MQNFNQKWLKNFGANLTAEQRQYARIGTDDGFLWHAFSFGYLDCLEGDDARRAFDSADKNGAVKASYKYTGEGVGYCVSEDGALTEEYDTSEKIDRAEDIEVYIVGGCKWCYIRTHEGNFGPYFCTAE